jgi:peptidoglycan hydrolase-like protein with peptidoglycan-binding domain
VTLAFGAAAPEVQQIQEFLNLLPTVRARLNPDGRFGLLTQARVKEFQRANRLADDGIVGDLTMAAITEALRLLGLFPPPTPTVQAVRPINQQILGLEGTDNLIEQIIPSIMTIDRGTFLPGSVANHPRFVPARTTVGRLGIFAAKKANSERAIILLLPQTGTPDRINICITQGFAQATAALDKLGWNNPLSKPFLEFVLLKHVINRWGAQTLASKKQMAFLYIVRAKAISELGPFLNDGPFVRQVLTELVSLTNNAFSFEHVEAFTFSSGISEFNVFLRSLVGQLNVEAVYNTDPNPALSAAAPEGAVRKQFLSGQTFRGSIPPGGFEFMPESRWENEPAFVGRNTFAAPPIFNYLHNHCIPLYTLHLGIQLS